MVGISIKQEFKKIFALREVCSKLNKTQLMLVPKKQGAKIVAKFKLIKVGNTVYKVITKILILRLRPLLNEMIDPTQTGFIL